jgi:hypothetical protein
MIGFNLTKKSFKILEGLSNSSHFFYVDYRNSAARSSLSPNLKSH